VDKYFTLIKKNVKRGVKKGKNSAGCAQNRGAVDKRGWSKNNARVKILLSGGKK
jgi:hypothetical protein